MNVVNVSPIKMQFMSLLIVSSHTKTSKFFSAIAEKESVAYILVEKREQVMFALREQRINLVLFDWEISEDAEKLLVEVRKEFSPKKLPVIVVHNFESEEFVLKTLDLGATDFIYKPFQGALEQIKIRNLLLLQQTNEILESKEEEIAGFREFNSSIINSSKECFKILDLQGNLLSMNKAGQEMLEIVNIEPFIGQSWIEFWKGDDYIKVKNALAKAKSGSVGSFEGFCPTQTGKPKWWSIIISPILNKDGIVDRLLSVSRDISNVKNAENELLKAKNKLVRQLNFTESLIDNIPNPIFYKGRDGKYLGCNEAFEKFTGKKSSEIIDKTVFQLWNTERAEIYHSKDLELMEQGGSQRYEFQVTNAQGELRDVIFLKKCFLNDQNQVAGIIGTYIDITDRIKAEQRIMESEERYKRLVNNTTSLILEVNADTHEIVSCNPAMANSLNKTVDVLLGRKLSDILPASLFVKRKEMGERALKEMKVLRFEDERNGRYFLNNLIPYVNEKGRFVQSITHDITNTKIKQDLIDNEEALSSIIENIPFAVLVGTLTGDLIRVNSTTVKYTGYTLDELLKMNITDIDTYSKNRDNLVLIHEQLYGGEGIVFQTIHTRKDGTTYPAEVNVTAIKLKQEPLLIAIIQDITDRKKAEEDLRISEAKYRELNATKDKFFSIISHDLRSPFNAILGLSDLAVKKLQNKEYQKIQTYTEAIHQTSRQAYSLLNNLLCWSRLQRGKIDFKPEKINLSEEVQKAVGLMRANLSEKSIYLSVNIPGNLTIYADPDMLETIIRNLLSNAVKFTNKNGKISILAKQREGAVLVEIEDSGVGIDSENMNKLFSISSNYSTQGTNKEEGSGLGLVLCKEFVEKHNGKIWVESEVGKGTKFSFMI